MDSIQAETDIPVDFLERLKQIYPHEYPGIYDSFRADKEYAFRINCLKTTPQLLRERLTHEHIRFSERDWPQGSFVLQSGLRELQESPVYKEGLIYVQNLSSLLPVSVLQPQPGEKILDLCASPGAKTSQIASLAGKGAELVAIEKIRGRYYKLQSTLRSQGADFVKTILMDGTRAGKRFPGYFDKVLLDAPCSCEARFHVKEPKSYKYWSKRKVHEMAHKQKKLLSSALDCLKERGELVYSTCSFSPEENEDVIDRVLRERGDFELLPIELPKDVCSVNGLEAWGQTIFSTQVRRAVRIIPDGLWEGFFIARLRKSSIVLNHV